MKRIIASVLAIATLAGAGAASAQSWHGGHDRDGGRDHRQAERAYARGYTHGYNRGEWRGEARGERWGERREWRRGGYWPRGYGYYVSDPYRYHLRRAPYGYRWVRDDYGQFVLVAIATGLIADVIYNGGY